MAKRNARLEFNIKRIKGFLSALRRSKRGMFGVVILVVAVVIALGAPIFGPHDPINDYPLAGRLVPPAWMRYLPGGQGLTENMVPVDEAALLQGTNGLGAFNVTITNSSQNVVVQHSAFGYVVNGSGSIAIIYKGTDLPINSSLTIRISRDFYYPYSGHPGGMITTAVMLMSKIGGVDVSPTLFLRQNWLSFVSPGVYSYKQFPFQFGKDPQHQYLAIPSTFSEDNFTGPYATPNKISWQSPLALAPLDAQGADLDTLKRYFPQAGSYTYGVSITIKKVTPNADAIIYLDGLKLNLPGSSYGLLGTDTYGADVFSQLVWGTRISLYVGLVASILSVFIGLIVGLVAAYVGGIVDEVMMRFTDALLVLPGLPLMIVLITILAAGQYSLNIFIIIIGFMGWMGFARVVRSQVLSLKERPYVEAAKAVGAGTPYILARHILPNVVTLIYVTLALSVPSAIVTEAAFSFLGFQDVRSMSWGRMLNQIRSNPAIWWLVIPPGLAIAVLSLSFILLGYAMDEILNPRLRMRR
jgi:peptide/nickel transport system permease protein